MYDTFIYSLNTPILKYIIIFNFILIIVGNLIKRRKKLPTGHATEDLGKSVPYLVDMFLFLLLQQLLHWKQKMLF